jgi:MFS family permease
MSRPGREESTSDVDVIERQPTRQSHDSVEKPQIQQNSRGVVRIEAVKLTMDNQKHGKLVLYLFGLSILICAWAYSLDSSTTYNYDPYATSSFGKHSMISTLSIATKIISAVGRPILAKISDVSSRPATYVLVIAFYTVGYIIVASCTTISAFIVGQALVAVGSAGLDLLNDIIVGDLTPLKWRGFVSSLLSTPFIINTWFSGLIVQDLLDGNWRWGYGMFAIIMPVVLSPAILIMFWLQRRAAKLHIIETETVERPSIQKRLWDTLVEVDALGLIIMGFGWSLLLLPFSLYPYAEKGWKNPSLIAMMVSGGVFLICYVIYEIFVAPFPSAPRRVVLNKTFVMSVIIDFIYMMAGNLRSLYLSSYVWIVKDWSAQEWTYFNNTLTLTLCVFGVVAGVIQRLTHRYKYLQICGLVIKIIGMGTMIDTNGFCRNNTQALVWQQLLVGIGGSFSVVGSRVASQASVPHQDLAIVVSLLSLWSSIGSAVGSAVAAPIWSSKMPAQLRKYLPDSVSDAQVMKFFGNIKAIRQYDYDSEIRQGAITAYSKTMWYLFVPGLSICFIPLICACFQTNFFLGDTQNAVDEAAQAEKEQRPNTSNLSWKDKLANFYNQPLSGRR